MKNTDATVVQWLCWKIQQKQEIHLCQRSFIRLLTGLVARLWCIFFSIDQWYRIAVSRNFLHPSNAKGIYIIIHVYVCLSHKMVTAIEDTRNAVNIGGRSRGFIHGLWLVLLCLLRNILGLFLFLFELFLGFSVFIVFFKELFIDA